VHPQTLKQDSFWPFSSPVNGHYSDIPVMNKSRLSPPLACSKVSTRRLVIMIDSAQKRGELIRHLEDALALADEIQDGQTGFLIERALDEARSRQFRPIR
jgi:hypothetical protein